MSKFKVGDVVWVCRENLIAYGEIFTVTDVVGTIAYHGKQWNDERELELVSDKKEDSNKEEA